MKYEIFCNQSYETHFQPSLKQTQLLLNKILQTIYKTEYIAK